MGHHQDLRGPGEPRQPFADGRRHSATDAGIDLVENQGRDRIGLGQHRLQGQRKAGQLAARRYLAQRPGRGTGVGGDLENHLVAAFRSPGVFGQVVEHGGEFCLFQLQGLEFLGHRLVQFSGRLAAALAEDRGRLAVRRPGVAFRLRQFRQPGSAVFQAPHLGRQVFGHAGEIVDFRRMLAGQRAEREQPFLGLFEGLRVEVHAGGGGLQ